MVAYLTTIFNKVIVSGITLGEFTAGTLIISMAVYLFKKMKVQKGGEKMADVITEITAVLGMTVGTLGSTTITLGLLAAAGAVFSLAVTVYQRIRNQSILGGQSGIYPPSQQDDMNLSNSYGELINFINFIIGMLRTVAIFPGFTLLSAVRLLVIIVFGLAFIRPLLRSGW